MRVSRRAHLGSVAAIGALSLLTLALGWSAARRHETPQPIPPVVPAAAGRTTRALMQEALSLYAAGQFPRACERFARAADEDPGSPARR